MKAGRFLGVLLEFSSAVNPEPGVQRAPTAAEQTRALEQLARRRGGVLVATTVTARHGEGLDPSVLDVVAAEEADGVLLLSIDVLRRDRRIDVELFERLWAATGEIGLLIEDEHLVSPPSFEHYMILAMAMNHVRARDATQEWALFVTDSGRL